MLTGARQNRGSDFISFPDDSTYNRWAEQEFMREYPDAIRAPPGSPYDFSIKPYQIEVKGVAEIHHEGMEKRHGRVWITMENHRAFGLMPQPLYYIYIYNGTTKSRIVTWAEMDAIIRSYKTVTRNSHPKGSEFCKISLTKMRRWYNLPVPVSEMVTK